MTLVAQGFGQGGRGVLVAQGLGQRLLVDVDAVRGSTYYVLPQDDDDGYRPEVFTGLSSLKLGIYVSAWGGQVRMSDLINLTVDALIRNPQAGGDTIDVLTAGAEVTDQQALGEAGADLASQAPTEPGWIRAGTWVRLMTHGEEASEDQRRRLQRVWTDDEESLLVLLEDD